MSEPNKLRAWKALLPSSGALAVQLGECVTRPLHVLRPDGEYATRRNIELGQRNPDFVEVLQSLEPGERVIVSSYQGFKSVKRIELEKSASGTEAKSQSGEIR